MKHASLLAAAMAAAALIAMTNSAIAQQERIWRPPGGDQVDGDVQLFRQVNFNGPHIRVQTAVRDLGITWPVRSIRVNSGAWQVCTGVNFTGTCRTLSGNQAVITSSMSQIRSLSPVVEPPFGGGGGQSLRGMATENTLPLLVAGLGIGWLVWKSRRDWGRKYPLPSRGNGRGRNGPPPRYSDALADEE